MAPGNRVAKWSQEGPCPRLVEGLWALRGLSSAPKAAPGAGLGSQSLAPIFPIQWVGRQGRSSEVQGGNWPRLLLWLLSAHRLPLPGAWRYPSPRRTG